MKNSSMLHAYYVHPTNNKEWQKLLSYFLNKSNYFRIHFSLQKNDYAGYGMEQFMKLPNVTVQQWRGMKLYKEVLGELTDEIIKVFLKLEKDFTNHSGKLWDYQLFKNKKEIFYIGDATDCIVYCKTTELNNLQSIGIKAEKWEPLPSQQTNKKVVQFPAVLRSGIIKETFDLFKEIKKRN